jgi:hypothetical protein
MPHLPVVGYALTGAAVGYAESKGYLKRLPQIGGSPALTLALAGYALTRFTKNPWFRQAGVAAIIVGGFDFGRQQGSGGVSGLEVGGAEHGGFGPGGGA